MNNIKTRLTIFWVMIIVIGIWIATFMTPTLYRKISEEKGSRDFNLIIFLLTIMIEVGIFYLLFKFSRKILFGKKTKTNKIF